MISSYGDSFVIKIGPEKLIYYSAFYSYSSLCRDKHVLQNIPNESTVDQILRTSMHKGHIHEKKIYIGNTFKLLE